MAEYIERESIYKILLMENPFGWNNNDLAELFREAKAADVAPVQHAKWEIVVGSNGKEYMVCTGCRKQQNLTGVFSYCPNCGAKMDESEDKNEIF